MRKTFLFVAMLATVACGGPASSASTSPSAAAPAATVSVATNTALGKILVDGSGRTLYLFEADKGTASTCYGACATYWPPLLTSGGRAARLAERALRFAPFVLAWRPRPAPRHCRALRDRRDDGDGDRPRRPEPEPVRVLGYRSCPFHPLEPRHPWWCRRRPRIFKSKGARPRRRAAGRVPRPSCTAAAGTRAAGDRPRRSGGCDRGPAVRARGRSAAHHRRAGLPVRRVEDDEMIWAGVLVASVACYVLKLAGLSLPQRWLQDTRVQRTVPLLPVALLAALVATQTFSTGQPLVLDDRAVALGCDLI